MRKTLLLLTTMALALLVAGGMALGGTAWAVPVDPPTVLEDLLVPRKDATNVALDVKIRVKFSEPMKDRTINPNNIKVYIGCTDTLVPAKVDYVDEKTPVRAVLKPLEPLALNTTYRVVVDGADASDMKGVKDASGTPMEATYTFFFSTGTTVEPCNSADITLDPAGIISGTGFAPNSWITLTTVYSPNGETTTFPSGTWVTDATGAFSTGLPPYFTFCYDPTNTSVEVTVTDGADVRVTESFPLNCGI